MHSFNIFDMIYFILFFEIFTIYGQISTLKPTKLCEVCIIDSSCTDDKIYFNVSISKYCDKPLNAHFIYHTDVNSKLNHYSITSTCSDCYVSIAIDSVRDAWDYILTLKSPKPSEKCSTSHVAHCGGHMSRLSWFILGGLSSLGTILGVILYCVRYCRGQQQVTVKKKIIEVAVINV